MDLNKLVRAWDDDAAALARCPHCQNVVMQEVSPTMTVLVHNHAQRQREAAQLFICATCRTPLIVISGQAFDGRRWISQDEVKAIVEAVARESQAFLALMRQQVEILKAIKDSLAPAQPPGQADHFEFVVGKPGPTKP